MSNIVLKPEIKHGCDFSKFIYYLSGKDKNGFGWQLNRSHKRNQNFPIRGIAITGKLTNSSIGIAISKNLNLILTVDPIAFKKIEYANNEMIEILYKNEIFVFSLGFNWIFDSILGRKILSKVLGASKSQIWLSNIPIPHSFIGLPQFMNLSSVVTRLEGHIVWLPPKVAQNPKEAKVESILIFNDNIKLKYLLENTTSMIITSTLNSSLVNFCWKNEVILSWVHRDQLLNEICRDFAFYIGNHITPVKTCFSPIHVKNHLNIIKK